MDVWNEILVKVVIPALVSILTIVISKLILVFSKWLDSKIPPQAEYIQQLKHRVTTWAIYAVESTAQEMNLEAVRAVHNGKLPVHVATQALNAAIEKLNNLAKNELDELREEGIDVAALVKDVIHSAVAIVKKTSSDMKCKNESDPIGDVLRTRHQ